MVVITSSIVLSQTQQVNTQTGFPDRKADLPLESDKSARCHHKGTNRRNRPKGRFFRAHPRYLVLKITVGSMKRQYYKTKFNSCTYLTVKGDLLR